MEDTFGKIVAIFLCVIQMFFIPLYLYSENAKRVEQTYILSEITYNVDNYRNTGIIEDEQYNNMRQRIFSLNGNYNIYITHCTYSQNESEGNVLYYDVMNYNSNVEQVLEENSLYYMNKNDYISICVEDKTGKVIACYGGAIKNEAY